MIWDTFTFEEVTFHRLILELSWRVFWFPPEPTEEFEGQNKSIKSRVRSTLLIWDTFAFDRVMDVSARMLLRLSSHASLYPSHLPYLFLKQMRYLPWKHKMLKMSTREQCQAKTRPKEKTGKKHDMGYSCF
ncbi:hypothetical protein ACFX2G_000658 [Malus domestica]